jgi:integrase
VLNRHDDKLEEQIFNRINNVLSQFNKDLKILAIKADIKANLTSYVSRHTFASESKNRLEANPLLTMEMMGQKSFEAHKQYLKNFDHKKIDKHIAQL